MDSSEEPDKKMARAKSFNSTTLPIKIKTEANKRKSFDVNEAAKSLDLALVRLKKSKLVNGDCVMSGSPTSHMKCRNPEIFMNVSSNSTFGPPGMDNASLMSMNFSHYELIRNVSNSLCDSEGTFSSTTCDAGLNSPDTDLKNEHLERYFRSAEMWSQNYRDGGPSVLHLNGPEK